MPAPTTRLIPGREEFAELWLQWRSEAGSRAHNPLDDCSLRELRNRIRRSGHDLSELEAHAAYQWFVADGSTPVGLVTLKNISHSQGYAEIGYTIGEEHQNCGHATAAVQLLASKVFTQSRLFRLQALVASFNAPSIRVMEKTGFVREGLLRQHFVIQGRRVDEILFALLRTDWERTRSSG